MVDIGFQIKSVFDSSGMKEAEAALDSLEGSTNEMDISAKEMEGRMDALDISFNEAAGAFTDVNENFMSTENATNALSSEFGALQNMANKTGQDMEIIQNRLDESRQSFFETEEGVSSFRDEITGATAETDEALAKVSNQVRTFNEEALSALFAALAVGRQIGQMTDPGLEAAGVFELISNTLKLFFLPIALAVRGVVLKVRDALLGLPKEVKFFIGAVFLIIGVLAKALAIFAAFKLNVGGMATALFAAKSLMATAAGAIGSVMSAIVGFLSLPIVAIAAVVAAVVGFVVAWKKNLFSIRQKVGRFVKWIGNNFPKIVRAVVPVIGIMDLLIKAVNRLFDKDIETLGEKFEGVGDSIANMGDNMIESGKKMDKLKEKTPEKTKEGFASKFMPDVGGQKTKSKSTESQKNEKKINNIRNRFKIKGKKGQDPQEIATEVGRLHKKSKDMSTRET